ncbi:MAG TPA: carbohydrate kinase [Nocardioides sp.]|uniref:carbohydrate kinase family protein n=1 Tax=Nocardioides sp. TaxID=35761 RepID=UPI002E2F630A|nr:carbohydrate kinase [Nocardioides sp.]HEX3929736.1 carbohydrate kinase [Nocardioides sp.]
MTGAMVVGESLVDVVRRPDGSTVEHPGGSAANVAVALARLGRPVQLLTAYGDDERGAVLTRHLNQSAVGLVGDPRILDRTSTARASVAADGSATYAFDIEWRLPEVERLDPVVVHACSIGAVLEPGASDVRRLLESLRPTATITYDVNARPAVTGLGAEVVAGVERIVAMADLVKASDEDLAVLYPGQSVDQAVRRLLGLGATAVILTRGPDGATWFEEAGRTDVPAAEAEVADTIGAGDTFGAATIDALFDLDGLGGRLPALESVEIESILRQAARAAAVTVSRPGADPPYRHELL